MVFTGIVEEMGEVAAVDRKADLEMWDGTKSEGFVLKVKCKKALEGAYIGCSIAVNGTCLTVTAFDTQSFEVNCAPETLRRTDLGDLQAGSLVNLERSMAASDRNSGHFVQGHVDEAGKILKFTKEGESLWVRISLSDEILPYVVSKGYIAVDGTSLTVCEVNQQEKWFNLMLIAHTQQCVVIPKKSIGDRVNLEADCLGKYAAAAVGGLRERVEGLERRLRLTEAGAAIALLLAAACGLVAVRRR
uniref:Riboflavin synthase n=1 Tax=Pyrodinium bahamense TaxID=73915 RepID=A0A7S0B3X9_9DINO|mmetsp:Transcript_48165/g.133858  ORF Transcript_48165/g.133858 Transcript_48165/m.133858 type:complete len:246 (+) Transcript_48165:60-797(+)|eukprot:CAMPEP_0179076400 /NCGR_PEP_ID=MMETSP0796-20121207/34082_1 /TAXON_ID=73915 /ORGANISM="Pyrodinium bahamense, Strain pbaha01" /LENGTH=245 /DNA_ID=CAMNT_0020773653 /DNA_START=54 /DNA_END=791 /DNA_ORIENTATION=-